MLTKPDVCNYVAVLVLILWATSIEKNPKISASGQNYRPPPPKMAQQKKLQYFVPNSNYKVRFFSKISNPSLFHQKPEPHRFL